MDATVTDGSPRARRLRRRAAMVAVVAAVLIGAGLVRAVGEPPPLRAAAGATTVPPPEPVLPGGGRSILPEHRVLAHYGAPQARQLGILGIGTPAAAGARLRRHAAVYQALSRRPVMPAMELIAVIATAGPGPGGRYRSRQSDVVIGRYLAAARASGAILVLDIQPGRSDFVTEAKALARWLAEPDVSLAIDPEWRMGPAQVPGRVIGSVDAAEVNALTLWLATFAAKRNLPDKLVIVHQFTDGMIRRRAGLRARPGIDLVLNADGFGTPSQKAATYRRVTARRGPHFTGFKLFFEEDTDLMSPGAVLRLRPSPLVVMYE